jgi:hypothetical protein
MSLAGTAHATRHDYAAWVDGMMGSDPKAIDQSMEVRPVAESPMHAGHITERVGALLRIDVYSKCGSSVVAGIGIAMRSAAMSFTR